MKRLWMTRLPSRKVWLVFSLSLSLDRPAGGQQSHPQALCFSLAIGSVRGVTYQTTRSRKDYMAPLNPNVPQLLTRKVHSERLDRGCP